MLLAWNTACSVLRKYCPVIKTVQPLLTISRFAVSLSHKIIGDGIIHPEEPLVFILHGLLGGKSNWGGIAKTVANVTKRTVVTVDLRNHGKSPHVNSHKYEDMASDMLLLFEKLGVHKACLIGHGMGGKAAMCVSLIAPQKVASLLILDISPITTCKQVNVEFPKILKALKAVDFKAQKKVQTARKEAKRQLSNISDDVRMNVILSNINVRRDGVIGWTCNLEILIKHFKYIASFPNAMKREKYLGPTLFIGGQLSEFLPPDDLIGIREMFPRAVITYIPKTGHNLHLDNPQSFLELAIAFIKKNN